jgi:inner membrane protein involved in colicin E2 resistance
MSEDVSTMQSEMKIGFNSRSIGAKLILISVLAVFMTIPSFFVKGLVTERGHGVADSLQQGPGNLTGAQIANGLTIKMVDSYRSVTRSLKYVLLFLGLVFLTYFIFEVATGKRVHPAQYVLVGVAQIIFYLLLLSLSEKVGFDLAFLVAGGATVTLLSLNAEWVFVSRIYGARALLAFSLLYGLIYMLLRLQDDALLIGAIASFVAVATVMYITRRIDWYSSLPTMSAGTGKPQSNSNFVADFLR